MHIAASQIEETEPFLFVWGYEEEAGESGFGKKVSCC